MPFLLCLVYSTIEKSTDNKLTSQPPGSYKTLLHTSPSPKSSSLHCKQIKRVKNKVDEQP